MKLFLLCPVPEEQKPINEYIGLKENVLTNWTTLSTSNYQKKCWFIYANIFSLLTFFQIQTFPGFFYLLEWILQIMFWTTNTILLLFLIILSHWNHIKSRFGNARLFYEEASWYDGQIWEKPLSIIKNDKLILSQKIEPMIQRIQTTFFTLIIFQSFFVFFLSI